ncbi:MAG: hypothetical protein LBV16_03200 [Elusimicrobiota bacterium]|jgi:hypothetical protein|nr:hypothetical protein [Elusimicrobiota bacterium]
MSRRHHFLQVTEKFPNEMPAIYSVKDNSNQEYLYAFDWDENGIGRLRRSSDNENWTQCVFNAALGDTLTTQFVVNQVVYNVFYHPIQNKYYASCIFSLNDNSDIKISLFTSTDGINFNEISFAFPMPDNTWAADILSLILFKGEYIFLFTSKATEYNKGVFVSRDLTNWTQLEYRQNVWEQSFSLFCPQTADEFFYWCGMGTAKGFSYPDFDNIFGIGISAPSGFPFSSFAWMQRDYFRIKTNDKYAVLQTTDFIQMVSSSSREVYFLDIQNKVLADKVFDLIDKIADIGMFTLLFKKDEPVPYLLAQTQGKNKLFKVVFNSETSIPAAMDLQFVKNVRYFSFTQDNGNDDLSNKAFFQNRQFTNFYKDLGNGKMKFYGFSFE